MQRLKPSPAFHAQRNKKTADAFSCLGSVLPKVFATVAEPLTQLLSRRVKFFWNDHCIIAFEELKIFLKGAPVLTAPEFNTPSKLAFNASEVAAGAVLSQDDEEGVEDAFCDFSKKFI